MKRSIKSAFCIKPALKSKYNSQQIYKQMSATMTQKLTEVLCDELTIVENSEQEAITTPMEICIRRLNMDFKLDIEDF